MTLASGAPMTNELKSQHRFIHPDANGRSRESHEEVIAHGIRARDGDRPCIYAA